jgi:hypothetical protein
MCSSCVRKNFETQWSLYHNHFGLYSPEKRKKMDEKNASARHASYSSPDLRQASRKKPGG